MRLIGVFEQLVLITKALWSLRMLPILVLTSQVKTRLKVLYQSCVCLYNPWTLTVHKLVVWFTEWVELPLFHLNLRKVFLMEERCGVKILRMATTTENNIFRNRKWRMSYFYLFQHFVILIFLFSWIWEEMVHNGFSPWLMLITTAAGNSIPHKLNNAHDRYKYITKFPVNKF